MAGRTKRARGLGVFDYKIEDASKTATMLPFFCKWQTIRGITLVVDATKIQQIATKLNFSAARVVQMYTLGSQSSSP